MKKYHIIAYPSWEKQEFDIEAESVDEAMEEGERLANLNGCYLVSPNDVQEMKQ